MKNKDLLLLILLSILIFIYIFAFVGNKMNTLDGYQDENSFPTQEVATEMALYTVPLVPIYLIACIYLIKKGISLKSLAYPIISITFLTILTTVGICFNGSSFAWLIILGFPIIIGIIILSIIIGVLQDTVCKKKG